MIGTANIRIQFQYTGLAIHFHTDCLQSHRVIANGNVTVGFRNIVVGHHMQILRRHHQRTVVSQRGTGSAHAAGKIKVTTIARYLRLFRGYGQRCAPCVAGKPRRFQRGTVVIRKMHHLCGMQGIAHAPIHIHARRQQLVGDEIRIVHNRFVACHRRQLYGLIQPVCQRRQQRQQHNRKQTR